LKYPTAERTKAMWVFDGEEWTQDTGGLEPHAKAEPARPRYEEMMPELQVIEVEIVHVPNKNNNIVPVLPIP
jgi:hypothetical protein